MPDIKALDRLKSQLQTTGLQQKNQQLYQLLSQLIDFLRQSVNFTTSSITSLETEISTIPTPTTPGPSQIVLGGHSVSLDGEQGEPGPIGPQGLRGPQGPAGISTGRIFYFDPSDASDIAGYFTALGNPSTNPETTIVNVLAGTGDTLIRSFVTEPNIPNVDDVPAGAQFTHIHAQVATIGHVARYKLEMYKCNADGTGETLLRSGYSRNFGNTAIEEIGWDIYDPISYSIGLTQRLVFKLYVARVSGPANITVTTYFDGTVNPSYASTTISQGITGRQGPAGPPGMDAENIDVEFPLFGNFSGRQQESPYYEEGLWTPEIIGDGGNTGQVYSVQAGYYIRIGKLIVVWGAVTLSTLGTITGFVRLAGLPYTVKSDAQYRANFPVNWTALATAYVLIQGATVINTKQVQLFAITAAATALTSGALTQADLTDTSRFVFAFSYFMD